MSEGECDVSTVRRVAWPASSFASPSACPLLSCGAFKARTADAEGLKESNSGTYWIIPSLLPHPSFLLSTPPGSSQAPYISILSIAFVLAVPLRCLNAWERVQRGGWEGVEGEGGRRLLREFKTAVRSSRLGVSSRHKPIACHSSVTQAKHSSS